MTDSRRVEIGDLHEFRFPSRPVLDQRGRRLAFVVQTADAGKNRYESAIWLADLDRGTSGPLTRGGSDSDPLWLDDGRLLFRSRRDTEEGDARTTAPAVRSDYYVISPDGGEAEKWGTIERSVTWMRQIDATRFLVLTRWDPAAAEELSENATRVHLFTEAPIWSNGTGFIHGGRTRLGVFSTEDETLIDLTSETMHVVAADLSPDRSRVLLIGADYTGIYTPENRLYLCALSSGVLRDLSERSGLPEGHHSVPVWADDHTLFFGFADPAEHGLNTSPQIYRLEVDEPAAAPADSALAVKLTDEPTVRFGVNSVGTDARLGAFVLSAASQGALYVVGTTGSDSALFRVGGDGEVSRLTSASGSVDGFDVGDDTVCFVGMRDGRLPEVFQLQDGVERRITTLNDTYHGAHDCAVPRHFPVTSHDAEIDAWLLLPPGFDEEKAGRHSLPAVLDIHGGPRTTYGTVFFHEMQIWAAAGFAVIFSNPHGSDGRGDHFADIRGRYGSIDFDDLMRVVDVALERHPVIDPDRLGVTGGSYGGFMTNWIIGHTDRFAAAASQRSISNWITFWGTSDIGYYFGDDQTATTPWTDPQELWRQSPLAYADRVSTPTLFVHSDADHRCWIQDAIQMHTALRYHGTESRLLWIEGENHELSRGGKPGPRLRRLTELTEWFRSTLMGTDS